MIELYIWALGIFAIVCGATNGFAGLLGTKDADKENADRLSFFISLFGFLVLGIMIFQ